MKLQKLLSQTRQAIDQYHMIEAGDKIAIGISGGKDSLTLLYALSNLKRFYPLPFELCAISVDLGFEDFSLTRIQNLCQELCVPFYIVSTQIADMVFSDQNKGSVCSLCAKMRKGALNEKAKELKCNKVAYAHHLDDIVETMMLSMLYEGRFYSFSPITYLEDMELSIIRPMMYVYEADVKGFMKRYELPVEKNPCPKDGFSKREYVKQMLRQLNMENPGVKKRFFHAIESSLYQNSKRHNESTDKIHKRSDEHELKKG